ncbi:MAG: aminopeptidase [Anaerolineales bacterium]
MADSRVHNFARVLVEYSTQVKPGDLVGITTTTAAEPLVRELIALVLENGGQPHVLLDVADQDELYFQFANTEQLEFVSRLHEKVFEEFDVLIKVRAATNTRALSQVDPQRAAARQKSMAPLIAAQMRRGAVEELRWMSTQFPTPAYAMEADMGMLDYEDFFYRACHAVGSEDPVAYWQAIKAKQAGIIDRIQGHDRVTLKGPHVDLSLSIKDRIFKNACGLNNMPDGEIYTGPVEDSLNGWVHYTYPAMYQGRIVEGIELHFEQGQVVKASAEQNDALLQQMLNMDAGARYVGEFAIGTNYEIDRFTKSILFDEKIGGSFHMALGASYPETGGRNKSVIHWDMICDLRQDSEIHVDGELVYKNGQFVF